MDSVNEQPSVGTVSERLHALDLVRSMALLLGIVFHAAIPFFPDYEAWLVMDSQRSQPIEWLSFVLHSFRMATFFLLAGFFGRMMFRRKGAGGFFKDRAKRIAAPLAVFWLPISMMYLFALIFAARIGAIPPLPSEPEPMTLDSFSWTHLWFLYVLLLIYTLTLLLRTVVALLDRQGRMRGAIDSALDQLLRFPLLLPIALAVPVGFLLQHHGGWIEWWGVPTPDRGLVPNATAFLTFALAFWIGWLGHRLKDGLTPLAKLWALYIPVALVLSVVCLVLVKTPALEASFSGNQKLIFAALYGLLVWLWTFGLIGAALRFIRKESPWIRYLADSSYWLYIIHLPILVAVEALVVSWPIPAEIKLVLVVGVSTGFMLLTYHGLVRSTWLGAWLNGRRYPRKAKTA